MDSIRYLGNSSNEEKKGKQKFVEIMKNSPIPDEEILDNMGIYLRRQTLSRLLYINELYKKIINVHGVIMEFGVRWGQNLSLYENLRGIYEPYNYNRKIIGFDTFEGFPEVDIKDGQHVSKGDYSVTPNYFEYLDSVMQFHEQESPISHIKKYELIKGDATDSITTYLSDHPETIVSLAYFDFDLYKPTKKCLEAISSHLTKGSVLAFDELNYSALPGETIALKEVLGLSRYAIRRDPMNPLCSYIIIE
ncbi:crotonobetainyl-CoA--carnitine CoA-transferase [Paenibacillus sp. Aloe-11]|uniref:crotonobetainyl-CoA--carnitine CoA-transferase n=1 Tax=Paenibacillus sp. Aloe-11 TaxID=1050222 RepID=UPI0002F75DD5|nr:crotonobetainyl-CoA--carnitine CoA-transferase [Paenibacillus sp. Aloe-11]